MSNPVGTTGRVNTWKTIRENLIIEEGFNVRVDMGDIPALAQSIAAQGITRALKVQRTDSGKFVVRDGHRRTLAVDYAIEHKLVDKATFDIPIDIEDKGLNKVQLLGLIARENDSKPLLPLEEAMLYKQMRDEGLTIDEVCKTVFRGDVHVRDRLALLNAAPEVIEGVKSGALAATLAQQITNYAKKDLGKQAELVKQATGSKDGKKAVREQVDPDAKKKVAMKMKVAEVQEDLDATKAKLQAALEKNGWTQSQVKDLCEAVNPALWNVVKLIGAKTALAKIISNQTQDE